MQNNDSPKSNVLGFFLPNINNQERVLKLLVRLLVTIQDKRALCMGVLESVLSQIATIDFEDVADPWFGTEDVRIHTFNITFTSGARAKLVFGVDRIARQYKVKYDQCQLSFNFNGVFKDEEDIEELVSFLRRDIENAE